MAFEELIDHLVAEGTDAALVGSLQGPAETWGADLSRFSERADVTVVAGMPGTGKTSLLSRLACDRATRDTSEQTWVYMDCADARLRPTGSLLPALVVDAFYRRNPLMRERKVAFYLDGIETVPHWEAGIVRILDTYQTHFTVAHKGPWNAVGHFAERGRCASVLSLHPRGFTEHLADPSTAKRVHGNGPLAAEALADYLSTGGLPTLRAVPSPYRVRAAQDLVVGQLAREPSGRKGEFSPEIGRSFAIYALGHTAQPLSITKAAGKLKDLGTPCTRAALARALAWMKRVGLVYAVGDCAHEHPGEGRLPQTVYAADLALASAFAPQGTPALVGLMRNAVFLDLARRGLDGCTRTLRVAPGRYVDFARTDADVEHRRVRAVMHVVDESHDARALQKGTGLLEHAMLLAGISTATLVSVATEGMFPTRAGTVRAVPLWRWLSQSDAQEGFDGDMRG